MMETVADGLLPFQDILAKRKGNYDNICLWRENTHKLLPQLHFTPPSLDQDRHIFCLQHRVHNIRSSTDIENELLHLQRTKQLPTLGGTALTH